MKGVDMRKVIVVDDVEEFTVCPTCGYEDGFHGVFENLKGPGAARWLLICPQCSSKFDLGLEYPAQG